MKTQLISKLVSALLLVAAPGALAQRSVMVQSNTGALLYPTNLWTVNASAARAGLGLSSVATNPVVPVANGGTGATNAGSARTNLNLVWAGLTNSDAANFRAALSLGWPALTNSNSGTLLLSYNTNGVVVGSVNNLVFTNTVFFQKDFLIGNSSDAGQVQLKFDADTGALKFYNVIEANNILVLKGDTDPVELGPTWNDAGVRSALGLPWSGLTNTNASNFRGALGLGWSALTNSNASTFRSDVGLATNNDVSFDTVVLPQATGLSFATANGIQWRSMYPDSNGLIAISGTDDEGQTTLRISTGTMSGTTEDIVRFNKDRITFFEDLYFSNTTNAATTRTNLGLGSPRLTPATTNITSNASTTLNSERALEATIVLSSGWSTGTITLPTNNPQHGDLVNIIFQRSPSSFPAIATNAGGLGGPWYIYPGNEAKWVYDTSAGPARWQPLGRTVRAQIDYLGDNASATRTNLGLGLASLTNTSNVTMMRALSGSTNTNHPYSGTISVVGTNNTNVLVFSNGILTEVQ